MEQRKWGRLMYEVELKAKIENLDELLSILTEISVNPKNKKYEDTYFNNETDMVAQERELRVRLIETNGSNKVLLTYKDPPFDDASKSKPEIEVNVSDQKKIVEILLNLGFKIDIQFQKICTIYNFNWNQYDIELTVARVPELNASFVEIETMVSNKNNTAEAFEVLHSLLSHLKIPLSDITNEYYTDAVRNSRHSLL